MKSEITINRTRIHTDYALMQCWPDEGKLFLNLADRKSNDQVRFWLEPEDIKKMKAAIERFEKSQNQEAQAS